MPPASSPPVDPLCITPASPTFRSWPVPSAAQPPHSRNPCHPAPFPWPRSIFQPRPRHRPPPLYGQEGPLHHSRIRRRTPPAPLSLRDPVPLPPTPTLHAALPQCQTPLLRSLPPHVKIPHAARRPLGQELHHLSPAARTPGPRRTRAQTVAFYPLVPPPANPPPLQGHIRNSCQPHRPGHTLQRVRVRIRTSPSANGKPPRRPP